MGLFGVKAVLPSGATQSPQVALNIQKIPDVFYGGNNPVIYEPNISEKTTLISGDSKKIIPRRPVPSITSSVPFYKSKLFWIIFGLGVVVIVGASVYYVMQYQSASRLSQNNVVNTPSVTTPVIQTTPDPTVPTSVVTTTSSSSAPLIPSSLTSNFLEFPPINLGSTADSDLDQLTDSEEEVYSIDSGTWDTDKDGYYDGQEIVNLYNPQGFAPVKLIDSGLVREYVNVFSGYRVYYPMPWQRGSVDLQDKQVLFSAISGEFIEVRVFEKTPNTTFVQWFQINATGEQFNQLSIFSNRFGFEGWKRNDGLVVYFDTPSFVFVMIYHQSDTRAPVPYRSTMEMMYESFRPTATTRTIPEQTPLELPTDVNTPSVSSTRL